MKNAVIIIIIITCLFDYLTLLGDNSIPKEKKSDTVSVTSKETRKPTDIGFFLKYGAGGTLSSGLMAGNLDLAIRFNDYIVGYSNRGLLSMDILLLGLVPIEAYMVNAATFRYCLRSGPLAILGGAGLGIMEGGNMGYGASSLCAMFSLDCGIYLGPVGLNVSIEPILSKKCFVPVCLSLCLLF